MSEGRMPKIMRQGDGFGKIFVEPQSASDVPGDARNFHRVGEARAKVIACSIEENLGLIFQPAKSAGMDHPVAIALEVSSPLRRVLLVVAPTRGGAQLGI